MVVIVSSAIRLTIDVIRVHGDDMATQRDLDDLVEAMQSAFTKLRGLAIGSGDDFELGIGVLEAVGERLHFLSWDLSQIGWYERGSRSNAIL